MNSKGRKLLIAALVVVVGMAFRVSWNALRDIANAIGADHTAATLYPFVVDGLMALALVATLVLAGDDRRFALRVLGTYTGASLVLNYVHGLVPALHGTTVDWGRLADWNPANWALVLLATSLPVGSIYFGSDLVAKVLHHQPTPIPAPVANAEESTETAIKRSTADLPKSTPAPIMANMVRMPDPVPVGFLKSTLPLKPLPAIGSAPVTSIGSTPQRAVAATSTRPRAATGRVPTVARSAQPKRTAAQLLDEARTAMDGLPDTKVTAEGIRREIHTSPANARMLRDTILAERARRAVGTP